MGPYTQSVPLIWIYVKAEILLIKGREKSLAFGDVHIEARDRRFPARTRLWRFNHWLRKEVGSIWFCGVRIWSSWGCIQGNGVFHWLQRVSSYSFSVCKIGEWFLNTSTWNWFSAIPNVGITQNQNRFWIYYHESLKKRI